MAPAVTENYANKVASVGCATCTPSADVRCTAAFLAATFGGFPSVFAAYCSAGYLTVLTSMQGSGTYNLDAIPLPPGGNDGSACRTRSESITQSWAVNTFPLSPVLYPSASLLSNNQNFYTGAVNGNNGPLYNSQSSTTYWLPASGRVGTSLSGQVRKRRTELRLFSLSSTPRKDPLALPCCPPTTAARPPHHQNMIGHVPRVQQSRPLHFGEL